MFTGTPFKIFSGSSHPKLAEEIAKVLRMEVEPMILKRFACGEFYTKAEHTVRGVDAFVIQTCTNGVNEDLMELFIIIDSLKRSFAENIHVVMPHYGYARQDRVATPREPISAKLVADLIAAAGADHVITINLHSDQEQGFFDFPVDNLSCYKLFADYFKKKKLKDLVVVAPDTGATKMAKRFADMLGADLAILHKTRPAHNVSEVTQVVGDVTDKTCLIFDDMIDTAGTVVNGKEAIIKRGADPDVYLAATHAVFSDPAVSRLKAAKFKEVVVTNSIPLSKAKQFPGLTVLSVAPLLAKTIQNVHKRRSVSSVY
ncbi:ribose-phosphate pyrophosphokinase [Patescibacteria group bacterium]|nr:ribose-phosphate pyrophosphokinase [Patescibacteria group bacterium]MBU1703332.1 ribose-phosphate pyrophosphokinase [Patescibacteria group bacterium]MBU1954358.1 ribose-phosphate pyrophosphokinase [Patescibacteria group bacterium]